MEERTLGSEKTDDIGQRKKKTYEVQEMNKKDYENDMYCNSYVDLGCIYGIDRRQLGITGQFYFSHL